MKKVKILDVTFDALTADEALARIFEMIKHHSKSYAVTPNPEMLLEARKNALFRDVLNSANLSIPDGIGILWASTLFEITKRNKSKLAILLKGFFALLSLVIYPKFCRKIFTSRVTGTDLFLKIIEQSAKQGLRIFLLGAKPGIAEKTKEKLEKLVPNVKIVGTFSGSPKNEDFHEIKKLISYTSPDILFVAFGAPHQETWIHSHLKELHSVKFAMGIGGAFDFIAGARKRAPKFMQILGLEWLYRVLQEPSRWKRIWNATIKFPIIILKSKF